MLSSLLFLPDSQVSKRLQDQEQFIYIDFGIVKMNRISKEPVFPIFAINTSSWGRL